MDKSLYKLINPPFEFEFDGKSYQVRKASLEKSILYMQKSKELSDAKDPSADLKLVSYCIYLVLSDVIPGLTQEYVSQHTPGDIDILECLTQLGFMSPQKMEAARKLEEAIKNLSASQNSSSSSPTVPAGPSEKSGV